jgi:DNA-binding SARP family transcriptional activator
MKYCVLGPVEVADGEHGVSIKQAKERKLLAILLLNANTVVSVDRLLELMWGRTNQPRGSKRFTIT